MHRELCCTAVVAAWAVTVTIAAQDRTTGTPDSRAIVVEGCLQNADHSGSLGGTPVGTSATPANAGDIANNPELPPYYLLTDARPVGRTDASNTGRAIGTAGAARTRRADGSVTSDSADSVAPKTYALVGNQNDFAVHNGHRVEVTGTVAPPRRDSDRKTEDPKGNTQAADSGAGGGASSPPADNSRGTNAFQSGTERLTVTSIRPLGNTCAR